MSDITINYKGSSIATMDASGTKTLLTEGKYCEDDIEVVYVSPGGGSTLGTKTITANDTYNASSDSLDGYSQVTVSVPTGTARSSSDLTASNLTVTAPAGLYAEAASKTLSDANLTAGNIKKDVTIFGTTGTYEGGSRVLEIVAVSANERPAVRGKYTDESITEVIVDFGDVASAFDIAYCGFVSKPKLTIKNASLVTTLSDQFRNGMTFSEINFGGIAPTTFKRTFYNGNYTPTGCKPDHMTIYGLNLSNITTWDSCFYNTGMPTNSIDVTFSGTLNANATLNHDSISAQSLISIISCLADLTGTGNTRTLTLGATNQAKLTAAQIAVATGKGWTIA